MLSAVSLETLPPPGPPEICFAGRSNVGKSSLINALTNRGGLARASNTPGRTRELNYFNVDDRLRIVDLPGYGYARASKTDIAKWTALTRAFLRGRAPLRRVFILIDSRHGIKDSDRELMAMLDEAAVTYQLVFTKIDKIKAPELQKGLSRAQKTIKKTYSLKANHLKVSICSNAAAMKQVGQAPRRSRRRCPSYSAMPIKRSS